MYDELVKRLREVADEVDNDYDVDPYNAEQRCLAILEAADAIEELSRENESLAKSVNEASEILRKRWIPVSERPPKANEDVFVYLWDRLVPYIAWIDPEGRWETNDFFIDIEHTPKMWMPLPKPYKPPKEE